MQDSQDRLPAATPDDEPAHMPMPWEIRVSPYWLPPEIDVNDLPADMRAAIEGIVEPAYRVLVLNSVPGLETSTGLSIVHLLWQEILDQLQLRALAADDGLFGANGSRLDAADAEEVLFGGGPSKQLAAAIDRHLRLVGAKMKASDFLVKIRDLKARLRATPQSTLERSDLVNHPLASAPFRRAA